MCSAAFPKAQGQRCGKSEGERIAKRRYKGQKVEQKTREQDTRDYRYQRLETTTPELRNLCYELWKSKIRNGNL